MNKQETMITAMKTNDSSYDGKFYVGVMSTKIYCLPSCKAKLPFLKNVIFVKTREEAIAKGLRGCKRCKSDRYPDVLPTWIPRLIKHFSKNIGLRMTEKDLIEIAKVDVTTVRRYFKAAHKMTPLAYHRKIRLAYAKGMIEQGANYLEAAFDSGFESASGFRDAFIKEFKHTPVSRIKRGK